MPVGESVILTVPARSQYARTVRLVAAELASRACMNIDGIDDVRLAVEEAFVYASRHAQEDELDFAFLVEEGRITLSVGPLTSQSTNDEAPDSDERFARYILESMCDSCEIGEQDGIFRLRVVKSAG